MDEGEMSGSEWRLMSVWSSKTAADAEIRSLAKTFFMNNQSLSFRHPYVLQSLYMDTSSTSSEEDQEFDIYTAEELRRDDAEVDEIMTRLEDWVQRDRSLRAAREARQGLFKAREKIDNNLREGKVSIDEYNAAVSAWLQDAIDANYFAFASIS